ncbi:unnamed protein product [Paramecium octaurelia]|uniref:Uncharacterized protein n=1 Tax=Paramecium octaurelia TaxID=43137 RepID=A0A8S1XTX3_PAROT|nr:unnamed protein product [Paramecium octaurelia]
MFTFSIIPQNKNPNIIGMITKNQVLGIKNLAYQNMHQLLYTSAKVQQFINNSTQQLKNYFKL